MKDNKLIAEFMGMEHCYRPYGDGFMEVKENGSCIELEDLQYHLSWDSLMPVVQKCFKVSRTYNIVDNKMGFNNRVDAVANLECLLRSLTYPFIGGTYKAVVQFINEFNNRIQVTRI